MEFDAKYFLHLLWRCYVSYKFNQKNAMQCDNYVPEQALLQ
jgi:hypothetical protein